jgi:murein DD-endopeptidase MepM/ murein hydrolase activator NlpD
VFAQPTHTHPLRRALVPAAPRRRWAGISALALTCSTVAWASLPQAGGLRGAEQRQWQALAIAPLSSGGVTGMRMVPTAAVETIEFAPKRAVPAQIAAPDKAPPPPEPLRIRGRAGDGLYWALRASGASPQLAADYLAALATEIDVGEVGPADSFDLVVGRNRQLLYAGLDRAMAGDLQLVRWNAQGGAKWIDAADAARPAPAAAGMAWPVAGRITSYFGYRRHPILRFMRLHAGVDFGADWGSPIVAAADGQVVGAGWSGGYGRQVRLAHGDGLVSTYSHLSDIATEPGTIVRRGEVIGYVGSSGLSTGPHLHFEVKRGGVPVNPLAVRFIGAPVVDKRLAVAVKARLKALLSVGVKGG